MFVRVSIINEGSLGLCWEISDELNKDKGLLAIGGGKLKIEFLQNNNPSSIFVVHYMVSEKVSHRVDICYYGGGS